MRGVLCGLAVLTQQTTEVNEVNSKKSAVVKPPLYAGEAASRFDLGSVQRSPLPSQPPHQSAQLGLRLTKHHTRTAGRGLKRGQGVSTREQGPQFDLHLGLVRFLGQGWTLGQVLPLDCLAGDQHLVRGRLLLAGGFGARLVMRLARDHKVPK